MKKTPIIPLFNIDEDIEELKEDYGKDYDKLVDAHLKAIEKTYGKKRSKNINLGWASDSNGIASKIYGDEKHSTEVFSTDIVKRGKKITYRHSRETYEGDFPYGFILK